MPTVRNTVVEFDGGKCAIALGDVHSIVDPMMGQGANVASYAAFVLGEEIVDSDVLDARFCEKVDLKRQDRVLAASRWTNLMLQPPSEALGMLIGTMSQNQALATSLPRTSTIRTINGIASRRLSGLPHGSDACRRRQSRCEQFRKDKTMHCLTVTYPAPQDAARFKAYYESTHVPLASQLPGLKSCAVHYPEPLGPGPAPFCIFQAWFADDAAMVAALQSEIGQRVAADVPNYSPDGASLFHYPDGG